MAKQVGWQDYQLLDSGRGEKLERFGSYVLVRPHPQATWEKSLSQSVWNSSDAVFRKTHGDKGNWEIKNPVPDSWPLHWLDGITAKVHLSPFKHTGVFPEQSAHWVWMRELLQKRRAQGLKHSTTDQKDMARALESQLENQLQNQENPPHILNLFAYTGMASIVCAHEKAKVTHVDSSRSAIGWAKQNQAASGLDSRSIRWILDDVTTFVRREIKRGVKYDGIIMDPPAYGHGTKGEVWNFSSSFGRLLDLCTQVLVEKPLFVLVNVYSGNMPAEFVKKTLQEKMKQYEGTFEAGELVLKQENSQRSLSTGVFARFNGN